MKSHNTWIDTLISELQMNYGELDESQEKNICVNHLMQACVATENEANEAWENYKSMIEFQESKCEFLESIYI